MTLEEVGEKFQVTRKRIRLGYKNDSIRKMRNLLTEINKQKSKEELHEKLIEKKEDGSSSRILQEHSIKLKRAYFAFLAEKWQLWQIVQIAKPISITCVETLRVPLLIRR